jgi:hypothetical protein
MRLDFSDGSYGEYTAESLLKPYMLFCGTKHDRPLRLQIAARAEAAGFPVKDVDGPFGTVIVEVREGQHKALDAIEGVTSWYMADPLGEL